MGTLTHTPPALKETGEYIKDVLNIARSKNPAEPEFLQAVQEVLETLGPAIAKHPEYQKARWAGLRERFRNRQLDVTALCRKSLEDWYGKERAGTVRFAEAFEIGEYGRQPDKAEIKKLFPFY